MRETAPWVTVLRRWLHDSVMRADTERRLQQIPGKLPAVVMPDAASRSGIASRLPIR
jgi:hypothetical protein